MKYRENASEPWKELYIKALDSMPIGSIIGFAGTDIPNGWLICDGRTLDEETYPELYDALGGSGSTFTLPDYKGRTPVGYNANDTDFNAIGKTGGSKYLQEHSHTYNISTQGTTGNDGRRLVVWNGSGSTYDNASGAIQNTGTGDSGNLQPYIVQYFIIKAKNTTPTMASIVNTTNNSTTDGYSCDFINKHLGGVVLYESSSGTSGNITLSDNISNYSFIDVITINKDITNETYGTYRFDTSLSAFRIMGTSISTNSFYILEKKYTKGTNILTTSSGRIYNSASGAASNYEPISIIKVIGYK